MGPSWEPSLGRGGASAARSRGLSRGGFSLIDLIVSMGIVLVLIGLLMPSLRMMRETANRVVCASNARQIGYGVALYAEDHHDALPPSVFLGSGKAPSGRSPSDTIFLRHEGGMDALKSGGWDGLGFLYCHDYLRAPLVFYCPSHTGNHEFEVYEESWLAATGKIAGNYQYRGEGPNGEKYLSQIRPPSAALVSDLLVSLEDYSHKVGSNVLRADISVFWFADHAGVLSEALAGIGPGGSGEASVDDAWSILDEPEEIDEFDTK